MKTKTIMKSKYFVPVFALLVLFAGIKVYGNENNKNESSDIVQLTADTFKAETAKGLVLVDFWAAWCPPCRKMNPIIEEVAKENKDKAKVGKLNIDDYKDLAIEMKVESIPTIIVFKDGKEVDRVIGVVEKSHLEKVIAAHSK